MPTILQILFGGRQAEICFRIVYFYSVKCFRIILKSTGNARLFSKFVIFWLCPCDIFDVKSLPADRSLPAGHYAYGPWRVFQLIRFVLLFFWRNKHCVDTESPLWLSPTWGGKGEHEETSVKMHMKQRVAVNDKNIKSKTKHSVRTKRSHTNTSTSTRIT